MRAGSKSLQQILDENDQEKTIYPNGDSFGTMSSLKGEALSRRKEGRVSTCASGSQLTGRKVEELTEATHDAR